MENIMNNSPLEDKIDTVLRQRALEIDEEVEITLKDLDSHDLEGFAALYEFAPDDDQTKLYIHSLLILYRRTKDPDWCQQALLVAQLWFQFTPANLNSLPRLRVCRLIAAAGLQDDHSVLGNGDDAAELVSICQKFVERLAVKSLESSRICRIALRNLAGALYIRCGQSGDPRDLHLSTALNLRVLEAMPASDPYFQSFLKQYTRQLAAKFLALQPGDDRELLIHPIRKVLHVTPENDLDLSARLSMLLVLVLQKFRRTHDLECLQEMRQIIHRLVQIPLEADAQDIYEISSNLACAGVYFSEHWQSTKDVHFLNDSITSTRSAIEYTPAGDFALPVYHYNLGRDLHYRYEHGHDAADLEHAIDAFRRSLDIASRPNISCLSRLATSLQSRFLLRENLEDLDEAIDRLRAAVVVAPECFNLLMNLARQLRLSSEVSNQRDHLEEGIRVCHQALRVCPADQSRVGEVYAEIALSLGRRFDKTRDPSYLEEAVINHRKALEMIPEHDPQHPIAMGHMAATILRKFEFSGDIKLLEETMIMAKEGLEIASITPTESARISGLLSGPLSVRYSVTRRFQDLEDAIQVQRKALESNCEDARLQGCIRNSLASELLVRFQRLRHAPDIEEAIKLVQEAIKSTPDGNSELPIYLVTWGNALMERHAMTGDTHDLEQAICVFQQAIDAEPKKYAGNNRAMYRMANALEDRWSHSGDPKDLETAIRFARMTLQIESALQSPSQASRKNTLARLLLKVRTPGSKNPSNLSESLSLTLQVWRFPKAPSLDRIQAAGLAVSLLAKQRKLKKGYKLAKKALDLLPQVNNVSLSIQDQQEVVQNFSELASIACSLALGAERPPFEALDLLESGRGVILRLLMHGRRNPSDLRRAHPDLCWEYESLLREVNQSTTFDVSDNTFPKWSVKRDNALKKLEACVEKIRLLPGLGSFQKGLTLEEAQNAASEGKIIIVNVSCVRSDALIVSPLGVECMRLDQLQATTVKKWTAKNLTSGSNSNRGANNKSYIRFLSWIWKVCVGPIMEKLGYTVQDSPEQMPRVWWIGTGYGSALPFHAAGDAVGGQTESTRSRVLSSYTPTIKALLYSKERASLISKPLGHRPNLLVVSMPTTPGAHDLEGVLQETVAIGDTLGEHAHAESLHQPDVRTVESRLPTCHIAHFACHGVSNQRDPSQSGLLLQTATTMPQQDLLSVRHLSTFDCSQGYIAYLSACSTAENRSKKLVDEVLHVASGFQVAGFRNVIGCLWPADDVVCVEVARSFYSELCHNGHLDLNDRAVSVALHKAVTRISTSPEYRKRPLNWAQYIHFGA